MARTPLIQPAARSGSSSLTCEERLVGLRRTDPASSGIGRLPGPDWRRGYPHLRGMDACVVAEFHDPDGFCVTSLLIDASDLPESVVTRLRSGRVTTFSGRSGAQDTGSRVWSVLRHHTAVGFEPAVESHPHTLAGARALSQRGAFPDRHSPRSMADLRWAIVGVA